MDINLYKLIDLVHVPGVNRQLNMELDKWEKLGISAAAEAYEQRRKNYFKELYEEHPYHENHINASSRQASLYWFELQQYEPMKWRMMHVHPYEPAYNHQYEIVPTDVIDLMPDALVDPGTVVREKKYSDLLKKNVELQYVRYSSSHVFGTVLEHLEPPTEPVNADEDMSNSFISFFDYWEKYPEEVDRFVKDFLAKLPPDVQDLLEEAEEAEEEEADERGWKPNVEIVPERFVDGPDNGKDVNLYRWIRLSRLQEFTDLMMPKLEEILEGPLREEIAEYQAKKDHYRKTLILDRGDWEQPSWFVLTKFAPDDWGTTVLNGPGPESEPHKQVLSEEIVETLARTPVDPHRVMELSTQLDGRFPKKMDIHLVHYSSNCIMGSVCEDFEAVESQPEEEAELRFLFLCMQHDPELSRSFINTFMTEIVPALKS